MTRRWVSRGTLLAIGSVASALLVWLGLAAAEWAIGLRDPQFRYENALEMWRPDPRAGYANLPDFDAVGWGAIPVRTNDRGFRGTRPTPQHKAKGVQRIVGIGDSVMWGTGVRSEDSLLGQLESRLGAQRSVEVINAAVVGYSSLQALRFLDEVVMPLGPDVVVVNFCINDLLPTEDPFDTARPMHDAYLAKLARSGDPPLSPELRRELQGLRRILRGSERVWPAIQSASPEQMDRMMQLLVDRPLGEMADRLRGTATELVVLMIPGRARIAEYRGYAARLAGVVASRGARSLDLVEALTPIPRSPTPERRLPLLRRIPSLRRLLNWRSFQRVQQRHLFMDTVHPTVRGNAIIAERLEALLLGETEAR